MDVIPISCVDARSIAMMRDEDAVLQFAIENSAWPHRSIAYAYAVGSCTRKNTVQ